MTEDADGPPASPPAAPVRLRPRLRSRMANALLFSGLWAGLVAVSTQEAGWTRVVLVLVLVPSLAFRWLVVVGTVRQPWALEIGPEGVRFPSGRLVAWSGLDHVAVCCATGWRRLVPRLPDRVMLVDPVRAAFAHRSKTRPVGIWIRLDQVAATADELVGLVERFSGVPVRDVTKVVVPAGQA